MQANGLDERFNQTLSNSLAKFAQDHRSSWDEKLTEVVYAYNTAYQESTKCTPFEAMFGRQAKLPIDFNTESSYDLEQKLEEYHTNPCLPADAISQQHTEIKEYVKVAIIYI